VLQTVRVMETSPRVFISMSKVDKIPYKLQWRDFSYKMKLWEIKMTFLICIYTTLTLVQHRLKELHSTKYVFSKLIIFMLSIPDKKELNILAQYSRTYNL
jgi:hypothetical protein